MNIAEHLPAVGLGALVMGLIVIVRGIVNVHRSRDLDLAQEDFEDLAHSRKLSHMEDKLQPRLKELAVGLGGKGRRAGLDQVLRGADPAGSWYFTRRKVDGETQQALLFEEKLLTVSGLRITPVRPQVTGFSRFVSRLRHRPALPLYLRMEWEAPAEQIDERSTRMGGVLFQLMGQARQVVEPMGVHLHVDQQRVSIHSRRPLEGDALRVFLDVALELRRRILEVPHASGALRLRPGDSAGLDPIEGPVTRAVRAVGSPNDKSGPNLPYGPMGTEVEDPEVTKLLRQTDRRRKKRRVEPKVEVIPSSRY